MNKYKIFFFAVIIFIVFNSVSAGVNTSLYPDPLSLFLKNSKQDFSMDMNQRGYGRYHSRFHHSRSEYRIRTKYHKIKNGENLSVIAKRYHIRLSTLIRINHISSPNKIYIGQRIKVRQERIRKKKPELRIPRSARNLLWPLSNFGHKRKRYRKAYSFPGLLLKAGRKEKIRSSQYGKVVRISTMRGYGKYIIIRHKNHLLTVYSGLGKIKVKLGSIVKKGEVIALSSNKRRNSIRFQVAYYGRPVNPLRFLVI